LFWNISRPADKLAVFPQHLELRVLVRGRHRLQDALLLLLQLPVVAQHLVPGKGIDSGDFSRIQIPEHLLVQSFAVSASGCALAGTRIRPGLGRSRNRHAAERLLNLFFGGARLARFLDYIGRHARELGRNVARHRRRQQHGRQSCLNFTSDKHIK